MSVMEKDLVKTSDHTFRQTGCEKIFSPAPATTVSPRKGSSGGNGLPIMGKRNEPCKVCGNLVFILERLYVDGKLLHRTCFKVNIIVIYYVAALCVFWF